MAKTNFYEIDQMLIQARNRKEVIDLYEQQTKETCFDQEYIEMVSEQHAVRKLSVCYADNNQQTGFSEARRIIDEDKSRVLVYAAKLI